MKLSSSAPSKPRPISRKGAPAGAVGGDAKKNRLDAAAAEQVVETQQGVAAVGGVETVAVKLLVLKLLVTAAGVHEATTLNIALTAFSPRSKQLRSLYDHHCRTPHSRALAEIHLHAGDQILAYVLYEDEFALRAGRFGSTLPST